MKVFHRVLHTPGVGHSETLLFTTSQKMQPGIVLLLVFDHVGSTVRTGIVNIEDFDCVGINFRYYFGQSVYHPDRIFPFIVGGDDDYYFHDSIITSYWLSYHPLSFPLLV